MSGGTTDARATASRSSRRWPSSASISAVMAATSSGVAVAWVVARHEPASSPSVKRPRVMFVLPTSAASSFTQPHPTSRRRPPRRGPVLDSPAIPHRKAQPVSDPMTDARAKLYINTGVVTDKSDIYNILRPLLKQTVSYTYHRGSTGDRQRHRLGGADRGRPSGDRQLLHATADLPEPRLASTTSSSTRPRTSSSSTRSSSARSGSSSSSRTASRT